MNKLFSYIGCIIAFIGFLIAGFFKVKKIGKDEANNENLQQATQEALNVKKDIQNHNDDAIDTVCDRMREFTRKGD